MERRHSPEDERKDFYLYVDEFQKFATDSFASVLSEARKYRLDLIIAHQYVGQLVTDVSTRVRDAVFGNVGTMVAFRVGAADAEWLEKEFEPEFVIQDMVNLPNYCIYLKLMVDGITCRPFSGRTLPPFKLREEVMTVEEVIAQSRKRYARPAATVEAEVRAWSTGEAIPGGAGAGGRSAGSERGERKTLFDAACSICGKPAKVPFAPTPGRPVYCSECYEKIQTGTAKPLPDFSQQSAGKQHEAVSSLAEMGIEFKPPSSAKASEGKPLVHQSRPPRPEGRISFKDLKRAEERKGEEPKHGASPAAPQKRTRPDVEGIRKALQEAFKKKSSDET